VKGLVSERQAFDVFGNEIPTSRERDIRDTDLSAFPPGTNFGDIVQLPNLPFVIRLAGDSIAEDGEISGEVKNFRVNPISGVTEVYEEGDYFAIISGDTTTGDGGEVVGIVLTESPDNRNLGVRAQETGGFIARR